MGDVVLSTAALDAILELEGHTVTAQAGVSLAALQDALDAHQLWYPPVPTYAGAFVGGCVATNAAGAATFKYGTTRDWVVAITVVLANGEVLDIRRGEVHASDEGLFEIATADGKISVPLPRYRMPEVPKCSAGYFAAPGMDLIDLFIGSEGTLGVITEVTLKVVPRPRRRHLAVIAVPDEHLAIAIAGDLRALALRDRADQDPNGLDIVSIESIDRRSLDLAREDGGLDRYHLDLPSDTDTVMLVELHVRDDIDDQTAFDHIAHALDDGVPDSPLVRLCRLLDRSRVLDRTTLALSEDRQQWTAFLRLREAVPESVNRRIAQAKHAIDSRIAKVAGDMIVPFDLLADTLVFWRHAFTTRGLDYAIWGHLSDGNLHPNVIPRSWDDVVAGREVLMDIGADVIRRGGSPMAEHGVGRNPVKQHLLTSLYGVEGVEDMWRVKRALDPEGKLAPGVLLPRMPGALLPRI